MSPLPKTFPPGKPRLRTGRRRGSVLIAVLAVILLLSFLVTRFLDEALEDLEYRSIFAEPVDLRSYAFSMMELSFAVLHEIALIDEGKLFAPEQGWRDPLNYAGIRPPHGWEVRVRVEDLSGRLPLNTLPEPLLNRLLEESLDFDFGTSRELSSTLLDWIDEDDNRRLNGAESEEYLRRNPPYRAANAPLQSLHELRLLEVWEETFFDENGRPNERFAKLQRMVTVDYSGRVNLNSAPPEVLELLALENGFDEDALFDGMERDQPYLTAVPPSAQSDAAGVESSLLRVTVTVRRGDVPFILSALIEPSFSEAGSTAGPVPGGRREADTRREGTLAEQEALNYPFRILQLSEFLPEAREAARAARYSVIDIDDEPDSF